MNTKSKYFSSLLRSIIEGEVELVSPISRNIYVHKDSVVKDSIFLFPQVVIGQGAQLNMPS